MFKTLKLKLLRVSIRILMAQRIRRGVEALLGKTARDLMARMRYSARMQELAYSVWLDNFECSSGRPLATDSGTEQFLLLLRLRDDSVHQLDRTLTSIREQSYGRWDLFLLADQQVSAGLLDCLCRHASEDGRISPEVFTTQINSSNLQPAIASACRRGFFAIMDSGDILRGHALEHFAHLISMRPDATVLYSDEDCIGSSGERYAPRFKSGWNPDMLASFPYLGNLCVLRCDLFFDVAFPFLSQCIETVADACVLAKVSSLSEANVVHIPHILYHRKPSASNAHECPSWGALFHHGEECDRSGIHGHTLGSSGMRRMRYPVPSPEPLVSILIPTRDRMDLLGPCVRGILERTNYRNFEVLVLDNQSTEKVTLDYFRDIPVRDSRVKVLHYDHAFNYSAIINFGAEYAEGELLLLLNNDVDVITRDWIEEMVGHALRPEIGCVGAKLYYDDDTIQHAGVIVGLGGVAGHAHRYFPRSARGYMNRLVCVQNFSAVTAACLMVRKSVFLAVGGFNTTELKVAFNDVDFCLKVQELGLRNLWTPYAELYHYESKTRGHDDTPEKKARFLAEVAYMKRRWHTGGYRDPYYNPNLTLDYEDFSINLRDRG